MYLSYTTSPKWLTREQRASKLRTPPAPAPTISQSMARTRVSGSGGGSLEDCCAWWAPPLSDDSWSVPRLRRDRRRARVAPCSCVWVCTCGFLCVLRESVVVDRIVGRG